MGFFRVTGSTFTPHGFPDKPADPSPGRGTTLGIQVDFQPQQPQRGQSKTQNFPPWACSSSGIRSQLKKNSFFFSERKRRNKKCGVQPCPVMTDLQTSHIFDLLPGAGLGSSTLCARNMRSWSWGSDSLPARAVILKEAKMSFLCKTGNKRAFFQCYPEG